MISNIKFLSIHYFYDFKPKFKPNLGSFLSIVKFKSHKGNSKSKAKITTKGPYLTQPVPVSPFFKNHVIKSRSMVNVDTYALNINSANSNKTEFIPSSSNLVNNNDNKQFDYLTSNVNKEDGEILNYNLNKKDMDYAVNMPDIDFNNNGNTNSKFLDEIKESIKRLICIDTANSREIFLINIRKCVEYFGQGSNDTGSIEVQAAILTLKCRMIEQHLSIHKHDSKTRTRYQINLHKRAKILKYLKKKDLNRYYKCLKELGLTTEMVEGSIPLKQYHR